MPPNTGTPPPHEAVDIKFRNGHIERSQDPKKWRWTIDDPKFGNRDWEIASWQKCG